MNTPESYDPASNSVALSPLPFQPSKDGEAQPAQPGKSNVSALPQGPSPAGGSTVGPLYLRDKITKLLRLDENRTGLSPEGSHLPDDQLDKLFTSHEVQSALGNNVDHGLVEFVLRDAKKSFATSLLVFRTSDDLKDAMKGFQHAGSPEKTLFDTTLEGPPLLLELCAEDQNPCERKLTDDQSCKHYFPYTKPWYLGDLELFRSKRWHFLVPKFDHKTFIYHLDANQYLPFTRKVQGLEFNGGNFSEVTGVRMLTSKQTKISSPQREIQVALKRLKRNQDSRFYKIDDEWLREAKAYKELNGTSDHIIQGIGAYQQVAAKKENNQYYLILEWADGGSLYTFWESNPERQVDDNLQRSRQRIREVLEQLHGLAEALEVMHRAGSLRSRQGSEQLVPDLPQQGHKQRGSDITAVPDIRVEDASELKPTSTETEERSGITHQGPHIIVRLLDKLNKPVQGEIPRPASKEDENWRHGDVKLENILRFVGSESESSLGTLKLADLGRAQQHEAKTVARIDKHEEKEEENFRTKWYEPPDLFKNPYSISRLFDIWSMGCVIFESVLWLLYGFNTVVKDFPAARDLKHGLKDATPYWREKSKGEYEVRTAVSQWMNHIILNDPERDCAIGHLVKLVRDRLLIVDLPPPRNSNTYIEGCRTNATDLKTQLRAIRNRAVDDENYLFSGADRSKHGAPPKIQATGVDVQSATKGTSFLSPRDAEKRTPNNSGSGRATTIQLSRQYTNPIQGKWKIHADGPSVTSLNIDCGSANEDPELCETCQRIDILSSKLELVFPLENLMTKAEECDLCGLVYKAKGNINTKKEKDIMLTRSSDSLVPSDAERKFLRLCRLPTGSGHGVERIPAGRPCLPVQMEKRSPNGAFTKVLKSWLQECDRHIGCEPDPKRGLQLPKRLIDVKLPKKPKLVEPGPDDDPKGMRYIALSHKWGDPKKIPVTNGQNLEARKNVIEEQLPQSFQDAIWMTHKLDCDYLWIDSLCIQQDMFDDEADTMQSIFSNAYCVLAAASAEGASVGFLHRRKETEAIKMGAVFISEITNDFERDVLRSPLNTRGWVLQERALARRTIFFTDHQVYFECGDGVRCETLLKLRNDEVAFLGDPNFPNYTIGEDAQVGTQIYLFTRLFEDYSRLNFSKPKDRPFAIDGLMERLTTVFKGRSIAGLFEVYWGRCLLWQRAEDSEKKRLVKIILEHDDILKRTPPTWSWMAFDGPISFKNLPEGGEVDWNLGGVDGVKLPFGTDTQSSWYWWVRPANLGRSAAIQAKGFDFNIPATSSGEEYLCCFDDPENLPADRNEIKCVIVGSQKWKKKQEGKHYVIFVLKKQNERGVEVYERVGMGHLLGKFIRFESRFPVSLK